MGEPTTAQDFQDQLLYAALAYASDTMAVFPVHGPAKIDACSCRKGRECDNIAKHPIAELVPHGLLGATTDELTIRRWWKHSPRANIGLPIPQGMAVLDIDGPDGLDALNEEGWKIPVTVSSATRRGWHYWFRTTQPVAPRSNLLPHVDTRGPGGYVIAPPSMHAKGSLYSWELPLLGNEPAMAPEWLYELAKRSSLKQHEGALNKAGLVDMESILAGVDEGKRDIELFRFAAKCRHADLPYDVAIELIEGAASRCSPPFPLDVARLKVDSAYGRYQPSIQLESGDGEITLLARDSVRVRLNSVGVGPIEFQFRDMEKIGPSLDCELTVGLMQPGTSNDTYEQKINLLSQNAREGARREMTHILGVESKALTLLFNRAITEAKKQFLSQPRAVRISDIPAPDRIEYMVDQFLLDSDRTNILFGAGGSLKTYIMYTVLLCMAAGHDWLGRPVQKRNILLIDYETGQKMAGYRLRCLARGMGLEDALDNIHWWDPDGIPLFELTDPLRRDIERFNIGYLGIDHVALACGTEPEKAESALRYARALSRLKLPSVSIAHVTGNVADNPELATRPFGCHSEDTELLTRSGWKHHDEWVDGEEILGFNPKTEQFEWTVPTALHTYDYSGPMVGIESPAFGALVTPSHRMYVQPRWKLPKASGRKPLDVQRDGWTVLTAERLATQGTSLLAFPYANPVKESPEAATAAMADKPYPGEAFARFLGYWLSEGSLSPKDRSFNLAQAPGPVADDMQSTLGELGIDYWSSTKQHDKRDGMGPMCYIRSRGAGDLSDWLERECGRGAANKRIPSDVWAWHPRLQNALLEALVDGDGTRRKAFDKTRLTGRYSYHTSSHQLADDVQRLSIMVGRAACVRSLGVRVPGQLAAWRVDISRTDQRTFLYKKERHFSAYDYAGKVYCFTVPTDAYLTRRAGKMFVSGNSVMWSNVAALTWFIQKEEQAEGANFATLGVFQRKWNDTGRLRDFSVFFDFQLEDGFINFNGVDMRESTALRATQGQKFLVWDALSIPASIDGIKDSSGLSESAVRTVLNRYKAMFERVPGDAGGRGKTALWQRRSDFRETGTPLRENAVTESSREEPSASLRETDTETGTKPAQDGFVPVYEDGFDVGTPPPTAESEGWNDQMEGLPF